MKLVKVVILWVFTVTILHLISLSAPGMEGSEGAIFCLIMFLSGTFVLLVGWGLDWKGLGTKKRKKHPFE